ncbi:MAG: hypothetical protein ISS79_13630, partial [Phycisphaerae bacterium]|nr:hypothetical protein [Phycisphaerae bacterium]
TRVRVEIFAGLAVKTTAAVYTYRLRYNISGSPIDNLSFTLPNEYAPLVAVNSPALRSVTKAAGADGRTTWKVVLVNEVTGEVDIAVNFALPIDASTKLLPIPRIETDAPAGYRAIVAVQNLSRHDINVRDSQTANLSELAVSEQRKLMMSRRMTESLQYVFQSFEDDWSLSLDFNPAKTAARIQAVVDLLALTTVIDRNGRCRYEAKLALQNRSEQFLHVQVPQGLRLWSATVADQPVKPVTAAASPQGMVLIPLVKTSPGGLPYDVYLYFADQTQEPGDQAEPLVRPLNGITNLKPPAISIAGIPVMRTTWSLRLPAGYRYIRPGGNMSPVAGAVEMLSLNIEAKLDQLKRLDKSYRDVSGSSRQSEAVARHNWDVFNTKLNTDIEQAQSFLISNRSEVSEEDYKRLSLQLGGQKQKQVTLFGGNTAYIREQEEQARNDLNLWINAEAVNPGLAEAHRNNALQQKPDFIKQREEQQIARLEKELEVSQKLLQALQKQVDDASTEDMLTVALDAYTDHAGKKTPLGDAGLVADLLIAGTDKKAEVRAILSDLSKQSAVQIDRQQVQLRNQLEELKDNRLQRHFQAGRQTAKAPQPKAQTRTSAPQRPGDRPGSGVVDGRSRTSATSARQGRESDRDTFQGGARAGGGLYAAYGRPSLASADPAPTQAPGGAVAGPDAGTPALGSEGLQQYVAKGTYSLPVTLPEGEVRIDFARPAADARLTIWAIPQTTINNLKATAAVLAVLLVVLGIIKIWPAKAAPISAKRAIIYFLVFLVLAVTLGLLGLILSLLIIFAAEALRDASLPKTTV